MKQHTPGPWQFSNRDWCGKEHPHNLYVTGDHTEGDEDETGSCVSVCIVPGNATAGNITEATARLIAAAPDLLAALEACLAYIPGSEVRNWPPGFKLKKEALKLAIAAIAKAKGES